jgi:hypothetical protein
VTQQQIKYWRSNPHLLTGHTFTIQDASTVPKNFTVVDFYTKQRGGNFFEIEYAEPDQQEDTLEQEDLLEMIAKCVLVS